MISFGRSHVTVVLTRKCIKTIIRNPSLRLLILLSSISVFFVLFGIWITSRGHVLKYSSSQKYSNLNFDILCQPLASVSVHSIGSKCYANDHYSENELSPTDVLLNIVYHGSMYNDDTNKNAFATLLSSILMNGFPLLGVHDFIKLSDFVNKNLGEQGRSQLLNYEATKEQFGNLLNIRNKEIRLTPNNCWTQLFSDHLQKASNYIFMEDDDDSYNYNNKTFSNKLEVKIFDNMKSATSDYSEESVLAIIEILSSTVHEEELIAYEFEYKSKYENYKDNIEICSDIIEKIAARSEIQEDRGPHVTIRMEPTVIADTRNYEWSPRKNPLPRSQSGQLLYFISSFLTFQLEIQNFLASLMLGGPIIPTESFNDEYNLIDVLKLPKEFADGILYSNTPSDVFHSIMNNTQKLKSDSKPELSIPFYNRAYPTHRYSQKTFWHVYATMLSTILILYFSIPAAVSAGMFWKESGGSQLEVLCTLPGIKVQHSVISWCNCSFIWVLFFFSLSYIFFAVVLAYDSALIPSLTLLLCGVALAPLSLLLGLVISRPDALVVAVPSFVFVSMLPGLLYPDLAFDVQRTMWFELVMCLLPPSAGALVIRQICGLEALDIRSTWIYPAPVSKTPLYYYIIMLVVDCVLYSFLSIYFIASQKGSLSHYKIKSSNAMQSISSQTLAETISKSMHSCHENVLRTFHSFSKYISLMVTYFKGEQMYETLPIEHYGSKNAANNQSYSSNHADTSMGSYRDDHISSDESPYQNSKSSVDEENIVMSISSINKLYVTAGVGISVLHEFSANLYKGSVTCLLGSNGAGKTTLLKILCGIDAAYDGTINIIQNEDASKRIIGWCPQHDPLYEFLTVTEHLEMFNSLLLGSKLSSSDLEDILARLDMTKHRHKLACELSGGMKRRLSLALAFIGDPQVLLLDEPSTGCDSWTRELVRKDILSRKSTAAILVSTHHIDDVEVLSDRIWFLNDRYLAFDGPVSQLYNEATTNFKSNGDADISIMGVEFSSSDEYVTRQFINKFPDNQQWILDSAAHGSTRSWYVPLHRCGELREFMAHLEARQNCNWSVSSPSIHKALTTMYTNKELNSSNIESSFMRRAFGDVESELKQSNFTDCLFSYVYFIAKQSKAIIVVRIIDVSRHIPQFFLTQIILPFLIVLAITYACRDISYPKVELSSHNMGIGEIITSVGNDTNVGYSGREILEYSLGSDIFTWRGNENSDVIWQELYKHYYRHDKERWASFVINDHIGEWMESTVMIDEESLSFSIESVYEQVENAKTHLCDDNQFSLLCGDDPHLKVSLMVDRSFDPSSNDSIIEKRYLVVQAHQSLNANVTMLSNVTTDHAAPVFLKEIAPLIYGSRYVSGEQYHQKLDSPSYKLFSYPLPKTKFSSPVYIQRGYLGSTMIILYILLCTIKSVRFVTLFRRSGMKNQLHLSGLSVTSYWISNFVSDVSLILVTILAASIAIIVGGSPVSDFFLNYPPIPGALFLCSVCTFSSAIVATSYAYSVQSSDQLSSQLLSLMSTVIGGVFLKLFLDRHKYQPFVSIGKIYIWISPCFNFSSCLLEMFAMHMDDLRQDAEAKELTDKIEATVSLVFSYNKIMIIQTLAYLLLAILIDSYWVRVKAMILSYKFWIISFVNEINFEKNLFQELKSMIISCINRTPGENMSSNVTADVENINHQYDYPPSPGSIGSLSTASPRTPKANGRGIRQYLSFTDEIGFFPDIDPQLYKNARRRKRMENFLRGSKVGNHGSIHINHQKLHTPTPSAPSSPVSSINSDAIVEPVVHVGELYVEYAQHPRFKKGHDSNGNNNNLALYGLNIDIHEDERVALIGMNGGGKSSLFKTLAMAELTPISGQVIINGMDLVGQLMSIGQQGILGYVPQIDSFFDFLTVDQTLNLYYDIKTSYNYGAKIEIEDLGVGILHDKYYRYPVHSLSGGNKKKLAVVAASMCNRNIILLDECTSGVDPVAAEKIVTYLNDLNNTKCMLFSSHRVSECISLCNRVVILCEGRVFLEGPISCFDELSSRFYQVDITISNSANSDTAVENIVKITGGLDNIERIVQYTPTLIRMTYEKKIVAQSKIWNSLLMLQNKGLVKSFSFLAMDMEETLSAIMASQK